MEEWLSPRGSQSSRGLFSEEDKQESLQIEYLDSKGQIILKQDPEGEMSTMVVVKCSDKVEGSGDKIGAPLCGGLYKEEDDSLVPCSGKDKNTKMN